MKNKQHHRYARQLALDRRRWQERDGDDHRTDILLAASQLTDTGYLHYLAREFGMNEAGLAAFLRSAEPDQP